MTKESDLDEAILRDKVAAELFIRSVDRGIPYESVVEAELAYKQANAFIHARRVVLSALES